MASDLDSDQGRIDKQSTSFSEDNIRRIKEKYSQEMRDDEQNPIKICMALVFKASIEKNRENREKLSLELSRFLTKPDGILNLLLTLIDFDPSSERITTHNQRFLAVSNIIACLPKLSMPYADYCDNIFSQLKPLLVGHNANYASLATIIVKSLLDSPHARNQDVDKIMIGPILESFNPPNRNCDRSKPAYQLEECILATHNLVQNLFPAKRFAPIFPQLFYCYITLVRTPSHMKRQILTTLIAILRDLEPGPAVCLMDESIFCRSSLRMNYRACVGEDGVSIEYDDRSTHDDDPDDASRDSFDTVKDAIIQLLNLLDSDALTLEYFFHFQSKIWSDDSEEQSWKCTSLIEWLLEDAKVEENQNSQSSIDLFSIILSNTDKALELISRTLANYAHFLRVKNEDDLFKAHEVIKQSLNSCLTILEVLSSNFKIDQGDVVSRIPCILRNIKAAARFENSKDVSLNKIGDNLDSLIDRFSKMIDKPAAGKCKETSEFDSIVKDLNDKLVPVRVHALVRLKQLVQANDTQTMNEISKIFMMVENSLADQESYVFLACINLIAEMCIRRTEMILPKLMQLYVSEELSVHQRLNVGEVLVRLFKQLNRTSPYHADKIMNILINEVSRGGEELLKISCLTNIGELCRHLGYALGKYILDVLACVERSLQAGQSLEVRRAGIELLRTALMGVDASNMETIQREMSTIYRLLKHLRYKTLDDDFCSLVDMALDEIDRIAKELLNLATEPDNRIPRKLQKNLKFLSLLDDSRS